MGNDDVNDDNEGEIVFHDSYWASRAKGVDDGKEVVVWNNVFLDGGSCKQNGKETLQSM